MCDNERKIAHNATFSSDEAQPQSGGESLPSAAGCRETAAHTARASPPAHPCANQPRLTGGTGRRADSRKGTGTPRRPEQRYIAGERARIRPSGGFRAHAGAIGGRNEPIRFGTPGSRLSELSGA